MCCIDCSDASDAGRPLKKYRLTSVYKDDMDRIRSEIVDIQECIREVACRIEKLLERLEEL
jgi:predicted transcriptional regulator